jgi:hypothetical protein
MPDELDCIDRLTIGYQSFSTSDHVLTQRESPGRTC